MTIFPTKWRANEQQGEGWAPTSFWSYYERRFWMYLSSQLNWFFLGGKSIFPAWKETYSIWTRYLYTWNLWMSSILFNLESSKNKVFSKQNKGHLGFRYVEVEYRIADSPMGTKDTVDTYLEPETSIYKWLFQLDDEPNLYIGNGCFTKHPF